MGIIPTKDADFNNYINNAISYLNTNRTRLQISSTNNSVLLANLADWNTLYPKTQDSGKRTSALTEEKNNLRDDIEDLLRAVYNDIPESVLTEADRATLNLKERDSEPTARAAVTTAPIVDLKAGEGARMEITTLVESDAGRASRHPDADSIEICYKVGGDVPANPGACNKTEVFTQAIHTLKLDVADAGQRFWCYLRWKNTGDDAKSGPWSQVSTAVITD